MADQISDIETFAVALASDQVFWSEISALQLDLQHVLYEKSDWHKTGVWIVSSSCPCLIETVQNLHQYESNRIIIFGEIHPPPAESALRQAGVICYLISPDESQALDEAIRFYKHQLSNFESW